MKAIRANISDYTNRVLGVVKERYGLKDKSEALDKFVQMYGNEYIPFEMKEEVLADLIKVSEQQKKHYGKKKMSLKELDMLCEE